MVKDKKNLIENIKIDKQEVLWYSWCCIVYVEKFTFNIGPQVLAQRKEIDLPIVALCQRMHRVNTWANDQNIQSSQEGKASPWAYMQISVRNFAEHIDEKRSL